MLRLVAILAIPLSLTTLWQRITRETNSHSANGKGVKAYNARQYKEAADDFSRAFSTNPSARNAFNLGTSQVAAGKNEEGSATLGKAMADRSIREQALYNRGNSALASNAFDPAIRDYSEALRMNPGDADAKRNLEIALRKKEEQRRQQEGGKNKSPSGSQPNQKQPQQQPSDRKNDQQRRGDQSADSILRAVQQQEQEELNRMKRAKAERGRIGW